VTAIDSNQQLVGLNDLFVRLLEMAVRLAYFFWRSIVSYVLQNSCRAGKGKLELVYLCGIRT